MGYTLSSVLDLIKWGRKSQKQDSTSKTDEERPKCSDQEISVKGGSEHLFTRSDFDIEIPGGRALVHLTIQEVSDASRFAYEGSPVEPGQPVTMSDLFAGNLVFKPSQATANAWLEFTVFDGVQDSDKAGRISIVTKSATDTKEPATSQMPDVVTAPVDEDVTDVVGRSTSMLDTTPALTQESRPTEVAPVEDTAETVVTATLTATEPATELQSAPTTTAKKPKARKQSPWARVQRIHHRRRKQNQASTILWDRRRKIQSRSASMRRHKGDRP